MNKRILRLVIVIKDQKAVKVKVLEPKIVHLTSANLKTNNIKTQNDLNLKISEYKQN